MCGFWCFVSACFVFVSHSISFSLKVWLCFMFRGSINQKEIFRIEMSKFAAHYFLLMWRNFEGNIDSSSDQPSENIYVWCELFGCFHCILDTSLHHYQIGLVEFNFSTHWPHSLQWPNYENNNKTEQTTQMTHWSKARPGKVEKKVTRATSDKWQPAKLRSINIHQKIIVQHKHRTHKIMCVHTNALSLECNREAISCGLLFLLLKRFYDY